MATVGGNLCNSLPAGPMISLAAGLDGTVLLLDQAGGRRRVAVADFVVGAGRNVLRRGELLRAVTLPPGRWPPAPPSGRPRSTGWAAPAPC